MTISTWKLKYLDGHDKTPKRMIGWNIVDWSDSDDTTDKNIRKWIKHNLAKGTYRFSSHYTEVLIEKDEDVMMLILRWS